MMPDELVPQRSLIDYVKLKVPDLMLMLMFPLHALYVNFREVKKIIL